MRDTAKGGFAVFALLAFFAVCFGARCAMAPGPDKATAALRAMGFHDIKVTDSHPFAASLAGCSDGDAIAHDATATNANGERVNMVVCCGLVFKGCTVRSK